MEKQELLDKTRETLSPFETGNIIAYIKSLTLKSAMENPWIISILAIVIFYGVFKRSKFVLSTVFAIISITLLIRLTLPTGEGNELTLGSTLPFAFGGLVIGAFLIYFIFIKSE
ncbi:hypothetical protein KIP69_14225 [Geobacter sulfurreducens]|jgi:hypothetical protein|uniref:Uncharacterized protein n=3 Tax=Geobacter TaxID=28231 RepID=Q748S7_GEOSL|nr:MULTISPECIES: hypothetical protein [Geobacter]AAR36316.1 hypothetical protein GSU2924 [Geobacter sulfurreducens PCA]ADI85679.1 hypothetical protein KN400_2867 [Geobacter sulfurreducens KN400]AJY69187.1 hypothetical protein RW64_06000 [Geobacter sulfurreducens]ANA41152.1 hypothetical protein A2G06_13790 [Geobacter anodireducens]KIE43282.1 hypothetical protein SE37_11890 [Geobacter soli]